MQADYAVPSVPLPFLCLPPGSQFCIAVRSYRRRLIP